MPTCTWRALKHLLTARTCTLMHIHMCPSPALMYVYRVRAVDLLKEIVTELCVLLLVESELDALPVKMFTEVVCRSVGTSLCAQRIRC